MTEGDTEIDEDEDYESIELVYYDKGIDDLIKDLQDIKKNKSGIVIPVDDFTEVVIHHEQDPELKEEQ